MDMFRMSMEKEMNRRSPLADRMRPETLDDFFGQEHLVGQGKLLRRMIEADRISSMILYGPPGTGKTTLAHVVAKSTNRRFVRLSAITSGVKDIRQAVDDAEESLTFSQKSTILFIDEIHRFNKSQQDALLPHVEKGLFTLIGATTENPYFEVNKALLSRCQIFRLELLDEKALEKLIQRALTDEEIGLGSEPIHLDKDALSYLVKASQGDARTALNGLELAALTSVPDEEGNINITVEDIKESTQVRRVRYDKDGDQHYDMISAFIKSIRGSDPDAALHWMASMLHGGEDPLFIARRLVIAASEDIGNADPHGLPLAMAAYDAVKVLGLPEGRIPLAQAVVYLAMAPKSNASYEALNKATAFVNRHGSGTVPEHLKNIKVETQDPNISNDDYIYPHNFPNHFAKQNYRPNEFKDIHYYDAGELGYEKKMKKWYEYLHKVFDNE